MPKAIQLHELPHVSPIEDTTLVHTMWQETADLLDAHLRVTREWCPSSYADLKERSYSEEPWDREKDQFLDAASEAALRINTLTEDNLTAYTHNILRAVEGSGIDGEHPLFTWAHQWTAEEDRHGRAMNYWILGNAALDPVALDRQRFALMRTPNNGVPHHATVVETIAYASFQERATQISHRNTGKRITDKQGGLSLLGVIAGDEARHYNFYRDWTAAAMKRCPSVVMKAIARQLIGFQMPGAGIADFDRDSALIERAGIFGRPAFRSVIGNVFQKVDVGIPDTRLSESARLAKTAIHQYVDRLDRVISLEQRRAARR